MLCGKIMYVYPLPCLITCVATFRVFVVCQVYSITWCMTIFGTFIVYYVCSITCVARSCMFMVCHAYSITCVDGFCLPCS